MFINSLPKFFEFQIILALSPPAKKIFSEGDKILISGPSILKFFLEIALSELSIFCILIKQFLLFLEGTSQLYKPSFSVIAINSHLLPESNEMNIFTLSLLSLNCLLVFHLI